MHRYGKQLTGLLCGRAVREERIMHMKILGWQWLLTLCLLSVVLAGCGQPRAEASIPATAGTAAGAELFNRLGCAACHQPHGNGPGPALAGLYGTTIALENGEEVVVDEAYLRRSILEPQAQIHAGYLPLMPSFAGQVNDDELAALVEYIRTLTE